MPPMQKPIAQNNMNNSQMKPESTTMQKKPALNIPQQPRMNTNFPNNNSNGDDSQSTQQPSGEKKTRWWIWAVVALIIIIAAGAGIYFWLR